MRSTYAGPQSSTGSYKPKLDPGKSLPSKEGGSPADFYSKQAGAGEEGGAPAESTESPI